MTEHRPFHFYQPCGHRHRTGEFATRDVAGLGQVCTAGRVFTVCTDCCVSFGAQTAVCIEIHQPGPCHPCPRGSGAQRSLQGPLSPKEDPTDNAGVWRA